MEISGGAVYRAYVYNGGSMVAMQSNDGQFYWRHSNHLGSGHKLTNSAGAVVYRAEHDPHGNVLLETGSPTLTAHKFTSYERDSSGLDYANARMFSGSRARFTKPDPAGMQYVNTRNPESLNRYAYTGNDPVNYVDPTGLIGILDGASPDWLCRLGLLIFCPLDYFSPVNRPPTREESEPKKNPGVKVPLKKDKKSAYEDLREEALMLSKTCETFLGNKLSKHKKEITDLLNAIKSQKPFDGLASTIAAGDAGLVSLGSKYYRLGVNDIFEELSKGDGADAVTAFYKENTRYEVYFDPDSISSQIIIHEALHSLFRVNDRDLAEKLGGEPSVENLNSTWIKRRLFEWDCGSR
jgi:RHS repeat-associated protein